MRPPLFLLPAGSCERWRTATLSSALTDYPPTALSQQDSPHVEDRTTNKLSQPVEQFVIRVVPQGSGGVLRLAWDDKEYLIPFMVK